jgi:hypothetical protein
VTEADNVFAYTQFFLFRKRGERRITMILLHYFLLCALCLFWGIFIATAISNRNSWHSGVLTLEVIPDHPTTPAAPDTLVAGSDDPTIIVETNVRARDRHTYTGK